MSGQTGSCIVCGKFHATGHLGDDGVILTYWGETVLACQSCIPFSPQIGDKKCGVCGRSDVGWVYPEKYYNADIKNKWTCFTCEKAIEHKAIHHHLDKITKDI